jgi:hypothetical protein
MVYFYFEAKDEVEQVSCTKVPERPPAEAFPTSPHPNRLTLGSCCLSQRLITASKFTLGVLIVMGVLMCIGAFAISTNGSTCTNTVRRLCLPHPVFPLLPTSTGAHRQGYSLQ